MVLFPVRHHRASANSSLWEGRQGRKVVSSPCSGDMRLLLDIPRRQVDSPKLHIAKANPASKTVRGSVDLRRSAFGLLDGKFIRTLSAIS